MRQRRNAMPVVELALTKALHQLELARDAAKPSDEALAEAIAAAASNVAALRNTATGRGASGRTSSAKAAHDNLGA